MEKSVLDIICASLDSFFESERKIGTYIIQHTAEVVDMTVGELAQACGVSDASVSRFCKKINMKGFHHLKITLAKEISEKGIEEEEVSNHISVNDIEQSLKNILANKVTEITQTVSMMDAKQLSEILNKLNMARTVQFFAVGNTIPVAIDGAFKLNQIGIPAVSGTIWETQIGYTYNSRGCCDCDFKLRGVNSGASSVRGSKECGGNNAFHNEQREVQRSAA